ncbi:dNTP triphosphohydrolase [Streptomyces chengbuensis]|uniref:deoxyguanosinetriphosphate triphosphohydrolase family protein n=1 Tax=Streptomyces chengbuensis TaxID=3053466 RepID=UPI0025B3A302|nr:dNTP triphosphohydrolase [Streptomyces sp. HUAS CB01]WJY50131.1 dNTP triphosphohydrolase [Streptomyces sp. HUAS CB01]
MTVELSEFYRQRNREESPAKDPRDRRDAFERDRDRLLYSSAFRRLAGVAQVAAVREQHLLHNRLTHSLKVGQIGRRLAQRLLDENAEFHGGLSLDSRRCLPDIVESAGLAHDIGHPPFGHAVEEVMERRMSAFGGFEGNAQSFRVVTKLAVRAEEYDGLDLTRATLNAILKYPRYVTAVHEGDPPQWHDRTHGEKWGVYRSEKSDFEFARSHPEGGDEPPCGCGQVRSAAAVLMDWADDISYVTHDVYDYFRAGLMPLDALSDREEKFFEYAASNLKWPESQWPDFQAAYGAIKDDMPKTAWGETRADRVQLYKILNKLITRFMNAVEVTSPSTVTVGDKEQRQAEVLKQLTFFHVIERPKLALAQEGQKKIVGKLFDGLLKVYDPKAGRMGSGKWPILLQEFHARLMRECDSGGYLWADEERVSRAVCDYICLLTEDQAVDLYSRMTGLSVSQGSIFGSWFD